MTCQWTNGTDECQRTAEFDVTYQTDGSGSELCPTHTISVVTGLDTNATVIVKRICYPYS